MTTTTTFRSGTGLRSLVVTLLLCATSPVMAGPLAPAPPRVAQSGGDQDADTKRAKQHFYKGEKLFALGRFEAALAEYEAAFQTKPLPEFLFNIGQCHRNLGDYVSANFSFRKYLKLKPNAVNRAAVEELIAELEVKLAEAEETRRKEREAALVRDRERDRKADEPRGQTQGPTGPVDGPRSPVYKKWWFWTGVVVTAAAAGTATVLLLNNGSGLPGSDLGNVDFGK